MELKLVHLFGINALRHGFNRTFMELKHSVPCISISGFASFNRTFMELKLFVDKTIKVVNMF